jgi:hypothetical protein
MQNTHEMKLNVQAFGLASGAVGFFLSLIMGSMMSGYGFGSVGMMGGYGFGAGSGIGIFMGIWMAVLLGIVGAIFAWVYNYFAERQ